jgi:uncharacterized OsmC-like protein
MTTNFADVFQGVHGALKSGDAAPVATFETQSRQVAGLKSVAKARQFEIEVDEPEDLGGADSAPNPVEYVLAGLASCQEITYRLYADQLGIPLDGVSVKVAGDIDLRGFFAVDDAVRPGFQSISIDVEFDSPASDAELARLKETVDQHCPVLDIIGRPTPTTLAWQRSTDSAQEVAAE